MAQLDAKQRATVRIAASVAIGDQEMLYAALDDGYDAGLTINETREMAVQLYAYCGFPRALNALETIRQVICERNEQGRDIVMGRPNSPISDEQTSYEIGSKNQQELFGMPQSQLDRNADSEQIIHYYLRAHLFGDIFARDVLDWKTREFLTCSALAVMPGCEPQLTSHFTGAMKNGNRAEALVGLTEVILSEINQEQGSKAKQILKTILEKNQ